MNAASGSVVLSVQDLCVSFPHAGGAIRAVDGVTLEVRKGEILGVVGESGSGKSVTLRALMGLIPATDAVVSGQACFEGRSLLELERSSWDRVRGGGIGLIFQDPLSALNPVMSIGDHLIELLRAKRGLSRKDARLEAVDLLKRVQFPSPEARIGAYPHQLSGGMRQRVMIALAIACEPAVLFADEPTTALDVTVQAEILALLDDLRESLDIGVVLVSHDLDVIGQMCDRIAVMYGGRIVEFGTTDEVLDEPRHPYTEGLLTSALSGAEAGERGQLATIPGHPPAVGGVPRGCPFAERCAHVLPACGEASMKLDRAIPGHGTACIRRAEVLDGR